MWGKRHTMREWDAAQEGDEWQRINGKIGVPFGSVCAVVVVHTLRLPPPHPTRPPTHSTHYADYVGSTAAAAAAGDGDGGGALANV